MDTEKAIEERPQLLSPFLNERQRRILAAIEAQILGYGGVSRIAKATGLSRNTVAAGTLELQRGEIRGTTPVKERIRKAGGGRKRTIQKDPGLKADLEHLIEPITRGDPESALLWTCKSVRRLPRCTTGLRKWVMKPVIGWSLNCWIKWVTVCRPIERRRKAACILIETPNLSTFIKR